MPKQLANQPRPAKTPKNNHYNNKLTIQLKLVVNRTTKKDKINKEDQDNQVQLAKTKIKKTRRINKPVARDACRIEDPDRRVKAASSDVHIKEEKAKRVKDHREDLKANVLQDKKEIARRDKRATDRQDRKAIVRREDQDRKAMSKAISREVKRARAVFDEILADSVEAVVDLEAEIINVVRMIRIIRETSIVIQLVIKRKYFIF